MFEILPAQLSYLHRERSPKALLTMFAYAGLVALLAGSAVVRADPTPTAPGPGDVFKEGGQCTFTWDVDTSGTWKQMNVELMSGDNWNMIHLTSMSSDSRSLSNTHLYHHLLAVATLDGTDATKTSYSYDCPQVCTFLISSSLPPPS